MGGRGAGKTRAGSEWVRSQVEGARPLDAGRARRLALVGETFDQVRDVMIFGDSGILACSPPDRRPVWKAGERKLVWANGAEAQAFSAFDPEGLRGPQFDAAWVDELGCAAVDKGTNQPNKFLDPKSSESSLPYFSNGARDDLVQFQYLRSMLSYWADPSKNPVSDAYGDTMVDMTRAFVWAWDTRPFPAFPNASDLWSDGINHARGHWLSGRVGARSLASVVAELCDRAGLTDYDVSELFGVVRGFVLEEVGDARSALQPLMMVYGFDAVERDGLLRFVMRDGRGAVSIDQSALADSEEIDGRVELLREAEAEMSGRVRLNFVQADAEFEIAAEETVLPDEVTHAVSEHDVPLSMTRVEGRQVVERWLTEARVARDSARLALPPSRLALGAGDVVRLGTGAGDGGALYRVDRVELTDRQLVDAVRIDPEVYSPANLQDELPAPRSFVAPVPVQPLFMDLPLIRGDEAPHAPYLAVTGDPWPGSAAVYSSSTDDNYALSEIIAARSAVGVTETSLDAAPAGRWDEGPALQVHMTSGALQSRTTESVMSGANLMAIGDGTPDRWELFQFRDADLVGPDTYLLRGRLRGQLGSDGVMPAAWPAGSWLVMMDGIPSQIDMAAAHRRMARHFRVGPARRSFDDPSYTHVVAAFDGNGLRPYAPCHLRVAQMQGGDLEFSWIRRTRIDGDSWELDDVPLAEESERYVIRVMDGNTVLREETVSVPNWTYSAADRTLDGAPAQSKFAVAQVSALFGPGPFSGIPFQAS